MKAKLRTRQKTAGGTAPAHRRGEHHKGGNSTRGHPPANTPPAASPPKEGRGETWRWKDPRTPA